MRRFLCALGLLLCLLSTGQAADRLVISPSRDGSPTLRLPADFLKRHLAEAKSRERPGWAHPSLSRWMAGLALTLAVVLAGLLFLRRFSPRVVTGSMACAVGLLLFVNSSCSPRPAGGEGGLVGDRGWDPNRDRRSPGVHYRAVHGPSCSPEGVIQGEVLLEESDLGDSLRLVLHPETLQQFSDHHTAKAKR